ncbi:hypothetical protein [Pseudonocardia lacus]|uniref:hypothetical protein n=1 Tax=Pseudonocardia lacus TaxID=2835865 RepID=UPI001BDD1E84|nr:hypothetical protein [Pseudonocardia lacus]
MTEPTQDAPHVASVLRLAATMQRVSLLIAGPTAVVAVVLGFVLRGVPGGVGAIVGGVVALGLGLLGTVVMSRTARATPAGVMVGALAAFTGKLAFLLVFLLVMRGTSLFDNQAFAFTMLAVTVAYITGEVVGFVRAKTPVIDI